MALKNYTTSISVEKTIAEIQQMLAKAGASRIMTEEELAKRMSELSAPQQSKETSNNE